MKKLRQICKISVLPFFAFSLSCYSYSPVRIVHSIKIVRNSHSYDSGFVRNNKSEDSQSRKVPVKKYFAGICSFSPLSSINNRAISIALEGRFNEAEVLFRDVIREDSEAFAAYNNLGIVLEFMGSNDEAFRMYSKACLSEPRNPFFRRNFLTFIDASSMKKE